jgi:hypothetical protein
VLLLVLVLLFLLLLLLLLLWWYQQNGHRCKLRGKCVCSPLLILCVHLCLG